MTVTSLECLIVSLFFLFFFANRETIQIHFSFSCLRKAEEKIESLNSVFVIGSSHLPTDYFLVSAWYKAPDKALTSRDECSHFSSHNADTQIFFVMYNASFNVISGYGDTVLKTQLHCNCQSVCVSVFLHILGQHFSPAISRLWFVVLLKSTRLVSVTELHRCPAWTQLNIGITPAVVSGAIRHPVYL